MAWMIFAADGRTLVDAMPHRTHLVVLIHFKKMLAGMTDAESTFAFVRLCGISENVDPNTGEGDEGMALHSISALNHCLYALADRQRKRRMGARATHTQKQRSARMITQAALDETHHHVPYRSSVFTQLLAPYIGGCAQSLSLTNVGLPATAQDTPEGMIPTLQALDMAAYLQDHIASVAVGAEEESLAVGGGSVRPSLVAVMALMAEVAELKRDIERALVDTTTVNAAYCGVDEMMAYKVQELNNRTDRAAAALRDAGLANKDR